MKLTGAQILMEVLKEEKVDTIFGYPGGAVIDIYDALAKTDIRHVLVRHEQGAVHVSHSFLCHDGAGVEAVAHDDDQSSNQCHGQCEPRQASTT